jgi:glucose-1-phosphate thymidylyltransferase
MKGIILAGGKGTRLYPLTKVICKQLLPIYSKPMIYYPLSLLMLAGIKEVLIITNPEEDKLFFKLLGDGSQYGIHIQYKIQENPNGLPEAFILGEEFIGDDSVCLVLGDNILFGHELSDILKNMKPNTIFAYQVNDPERYGVVEFDKNYNVISIEEKPLQPKSNYAIIGLYVFDNTVSNVARQLNKSDRGETEITDIMKHYLEKKNLNVELMGRGFAWLDTGTFDSLIDAGNFIKIIEERQGLKIADLDEINKTMENTNVS